MYDKNYEFNGNTPLIMCNFLASIDIPFSECFGKIVITVC